MEKWAHVKICVLAKLYDTNSSIQYELGKRFLDNRVKPQKGQSVLDLGCGTGRLAAHLAALVGEEGRVVGVDPNEKRVHVADIALSSFYKNIEFFDGEVTAAAGHGPFDIVFSNFVLHWVPDDRISSTLKTAFDCMKPGGMLAANITLSTGKLINSISLLTTGKNEPEAVGMQCHPVSYWVDLCKSVGFDVLHANQDDDVQWPFENIGKLFDLVKAYTVGHIDGHTISSENLTALLQQYGIASTDAPVTIHSQIVEIIVQKPGESRLV